MIDSQRTAENTIKIKVTRDMIGNDTNIKQGSNEAN